MFNRRRSTILGPLRRTTRSRRPGSGPTAIRVEGQPADPRTPPGAGETSTAEQEEWLDADGNVLDEEDRGLVYDLGTLFDRRTALGLFGAAGVGLLAACTSGATRTGTDQTSAPTSATPSGSSEPTTDASTGDAVSVTEVPDETQGPYPADGSNGVNVLDDSGIVRSDIRSSFGASTTTAQGVPLTFSLTVRDAATGLVMPGLAVYAWHCDADGNYSLYSSGVENENYLRGVQETAADGTVTFTSIFPGCYSGRWPHIHFEVYESLANATSSGRILKTSQIALPQEVCEAVYSQADYPGSTRNLSGTSLTSDNVFGEDGGITQLATVSGDVSGDYVSTLTIGI
ncbi:intradiol ring-cleavage dioxygenase [Occultella aeris]|uniref:Dioxygenase n=1 Tax=Occultella aeris TaxID=2761496 RepID=A0A7M4DKX7_9MICO|nr:Dioxygenase [Occultella aeris]